MTTLSKVKSNLGITGTALDETLNGWIEEVKNFLTDAGVLESNITNGIIAIGVKDLWNYGAGEGQFSPYFIQRATQLAYKDDSKNGNEDNTNGEL